MNDDEQEDAEYEREFQRMREKYERELFALPDARTIEYWTAYED